MDGQTPRKKRTFLRRVSFAAAGLMILCLVALAGLPWLLGTSPARRAVVGAANLALAPSKVEADGLSASWFGSIRLTGLTLRDRHGKKLIVAKSAVLDRGLASLLADRSDLGTLTLDQAAVDIERRGDGSIDLVEALNPPKDPAAPPPKPGGKPTAVSLRVTRGTLRVQTPELTEPLTAESLEMEAHVPAAADKKVTWKIRLGGAAGETLAVDGDYDHHAAATPDLSLMVQGGRWPLAVTSGGVLARGHLDGTLKATRVAGQWASAGDAKLLGFDASGPPLAGDRLVFDAVSAAWDVAESAEGWAVRRLGVVSPVATLSATGSVAPGSAGAVPDVRVDGKIDLAALAKQAPHLVHLREGLTLEHGSARFVVQVRTEGEVQTATAEASVSDLSARNPTRAFTLRDPASLTAKATRGKAGVTVEAAAVKTPFLNLTGSGDVEHGVRLAGTVDLGGLEAQFRDLVDFGAVKLAGKGRMAADFRRTGPTFLARCAAEFRGLDVAGLTAQPLARDVLRVDAAASGPADATGVPQTWQAVRLNLKSGLDAVTLDARTREGVVSLNGTASVPVPPQVSTRDGRADVTLVGRWRSGTDPKGQGVVDLDEFRLGLRPADPALAATGTIAFAARGVVDLDADDLTLAPLPLPAGAAAVVAVAPDGLKVHGLRKTPTANRSAKGVVTGDLFALEQALSVWKGRTPSGFGGAFRATLDAAPGDAGKLNLALALLVPDLSRSGPDGLGRKPEGPLGLATKATYDPTADRLAFQILNLQTRYARLDAQGRLDEPTGRLLADLKGTITPNWEAVTALAAGSVEPGLKLQGRSRDFRVRGPLWAGSLASTLKGLDAELGVDLDSATAFGLTLGPAPLVVHCREGVLTVDPIQSTLNNGKVDLKPGLSVDDVQGITVSLAKGSAISDAEINDEVSRRVFSYVAPVLDEATHVNGRFSLTLDHAEIPVTGPPEKKLNLTGRLVFQDVVFGPGPFAGQLLSLVGTPGAQGLRLHQPVQLSVADGRVMQSGLNIPIRRDAAISLEGSVGFDQTLDLRASVPITQGMLGARSGLDQIVGDSRVTVPIDGTVKSPRVNRQAFQVALKELSKTALKREMSRGASQLLDKLGPPAAAGGGAGGGGIPTDARGLEDALIRRVLPGRRGGAPPGPR